MDEGHRVANCAGEWIEITTYSDPHPLETCSDCRAVRRVNPEERFGSPSAHRAADNYDTARPPVNRTGVRVLALAIVALILAVAAAVVALLARAQ